MPAWPACRPPRTLAFALSALALAACGGGSSGPKTVAEINLATAAIVLDATGQSRQLSVTALDEDGDPIENPSLSYATSNAQVVTVDGTGLMIAQGPGSAEVTVSAGSVSETATVEVSSTSAIELFDGDGQTVQPGGTLPIAPAVRVLDASDQPVQGVIVRFQVGSSSGTVTPQTVTTGADGVARVSSWRLSQTSGAQALTATVEGAEVEGEPVEFQATASGYDITLVYLTTLTTAQRNAFEAAKDRWQSLIVGDLVDVNDNLPENTCGDNPATSGPFDDVTIFVTVQPIDGEGSVLGQAGPCFVRTGAGATGGDNLTVIGRMQFDSDDMEVIEEEGLLEAVIVHEMGHVLGFGTLWGPDYFDLLRDPSDADAEPPLTDTHFIGSRAIQAFNAAGGSSYSGAKVPVMNEGGAGTVNSHWRDAVFGAELMTGFVNTGFNPLSAISVRSLQDMGYTVSVAEADPYSINTAVRMAGSVRGRHLVDDVIRQPVRTMRVSGAGEAR